MWNASGPLKWKELIKNQILYLAPKFEVEKQRESGDFDQYTVKLIKKRNGLFGGSVILYKG